MNIGLRKTTFQRLFGKSPARPTAGGIVDMDYDFKALDTILSHPVYLERMGVLNPLEQTFEHLKPMIQEAYTLSMEKFEKRK